MAVRKMQHVFPLQELACFRALQQREARALPERKTAAAARLAAQEEREEQLQKRYKVLSSDLADARKALAAVAAH